MPPFLQFLIRRFLAVPISLVIITLVLYGGVMLTPPEGACNVILPTEYECKSKRRTDA